MRGQSNTSNPQNLSSSPSATSSLESVDGLLLCKLPDGLMTSQCGPAVAHASPSATPEINEDSTTLVTYGRNSSGSYLDVALHRSLENRLRRRFGEDRQISLGSNSSLPTWVRSVTSSGVRYSLLDMWELPTFERDCTSWPTPMASGDHRSVSLFETAWSMVSGQAPIGSNAQTGKGVLLNPGFALWLMGYPDTWLSCGVRAMRSCLSKRPSS